MYSAERKLDQVCSDQEYRTVFDHVNALPAEAEHLVVQLGEAIRVLLDASQLKLRWYLLRHPDCLSTHGFP